MGTSERVKRISLCLTVLGIILIISSICLFSFSKKTDRILIHDSVTLVVGDRVSLSNRPTVKYDWISSDEKIVTVDEFGFIEGIKAGNTTIKVKFNGRFEECNVKVVDVNKAIQTESITLDKDKYFLKVGDVLSLNYTIKPSNATNKSVTLYSSDLNVAVILSGKIVAKGEGKASISVVTGNGNIAICTVEVKGNKTGNDSSGTTGSSEVPSSSPSGSSISVESINLTPKKISIAVGETYQLSYVINPSEVASTDVVWNSSDNKVATVSNKGAVTGKKVGTATITVSSVNGKKDTMEVNVIESGSKTVNVQEITLDTSDVTLSVGDTLYVNAKIKPDNATYKNVTWTSGNKNVAVVQDGLVTAKWGGVSTITAKTDDGKVAKFKVTVKNYNLILNDGNYLTTKGTKIVKAKSGQQVLLRGFNLGAWLSRSFSFMPVNPIASSKEELASKNYSCINNDAFWQALTRNTNVGGNAYKLSNTLYNNFITEFDLDLIAQSGATVLRVPFEYGLIMSLTNNGFEYKRNAKGEIDFYYLDWIVEQCKKRGIYVILDLHLAPGRQNQGGWCYGYTFFDDNSNYQEYIVDMWSKVASHFSGEETVAGYDIINEPQAPSTAKLVSFYDRVYRSIRSVDRNHIIFMEEPCVFCGYSGVKNSTIGDLPKPSEKGWSNVVYSTHDYFYNKKSTGSVDENTPPNVIRSRMNEKTKKTIAKSKSYNIPYYIGEFSHLGSSYNYNGYIGVWKEAMNKYDANNLNYTSWTYKGHWERYYGNVFYGRNIGKANIEKDSYATIEKIFRSNSTTALKFNKEYYLMFLEQWKGRLANSIVLSNTNLTLEIGDSKTINYSVNIDPNRVSHGYKSYDVMNKKVVWSSSNPNVVSIDSTTGKMLAKKSGTATITAKLKPLMLSEYTVTANCRVTVK